MAGPWNTTTAKQDAASVLGLAQLRGLRGPIDTRFEKLLERYGAVFNGVSDDTPAVQDAINVIAFDGNQQRVRFPEELTIRIVTPAGDETLTDGKSFVGLTVPGNLSVDFNGCTLDASASAFGSGDTVLAITKSVGAADPYRKNLTVIERGRIIGNSNLDDLVFLGDTDGTGVPHSTFRNMVFSTAANIVTGADNFYNVTFDKCQFTGWSASGYAVTTFGGSTNWGENNRFRDCTFFNAAGGVLRARGAGAGTYVGYMFHGCSMDYVRQFVTCDAAGPTIVQLFGCHLECNETDAKYAAANHYMLNIADAATESQIAMFGGSIVIINGGTGNTMANFLSAGDTAAAAPYGITLDRVYRQLSGVTMNATKTGRYEDNA